MTFTFTINPPFYQTWWFILICIITGAGAIYFFIKRRELILVKEKQVLETRVSERTAELNVKNEELGRKNKDITDSIRYAQRIQFAILPPSVPYKDTFVLFKPKDIVSGDFYWFHDEPIEFLAAVDCTGHGVPGAFMSIIGHIILNKIVKEYKVYKPSEILDLLNKELVNTLHSQLDSSSNVADGMDLSLINFNPETNIIQFAGAFNSLYHICNGEIKEYAADRFSIGRNTGPNLKFTNHEFSVNKGDMVFLCSDGYEDQFGGPNGKKFKRKSLLQLFQNVASYDAEKQKELIDKAFEDWKKDTEQIDDVLVIGRKF